MGSTHDEHLAGKVEAMHRVVASALAALEPLFRHHKLTFVARNTNPAMDADIVISADDIEKVAEVLLEQARRADERRMVRG